MELPGSAYTIASLSIRLTCVAANHGDASFSL
jgi:hypothetical protein